MEKQNICQTCAKPFLIIAMELKFLERMGYPEPTDCPKCRHQKRQAYRGWRDFYKRSCDKCKRKIITVYPPDSGFTVYCQKCWQDYYHHSDPLKDIKKPIAGEIRV